MHHTKVTPGFFQGHTRVQRFLTVILTRFLFNYYSSTFFVVVPEPSLLRPFLPACPHELMKTHATHCSSNYAAATMLRASWHPHALPHRQQQLHHQPQQQRQQRQQQPPPAASSTSVSHRCCAPLRASPYFTTDTVTQEAFQEQEYESTQQGQRRKAWQAAVQKATGRKPHLIWQPELDSPLLLAGVTVILVGPKKPISCGTIARSLSSFECDDLRVVQPRCQPNTR